MGGPERLVLLGRVVGVHGVRGEVRIESWTEPRAHIFRYQPWLLGSAGDRREVSGATGAARGRGLVARIPGVDDRDTAAGLIGSEIHVSRSQLPPPAAGEFYWSDLEGLEVRNLEGVEFGRVSHLIATGANDVLVVRGERERLVPFLKGSAVVEVDLDAGRITVDWDPDF